VRDIAYLSEDDNGQAYLCLHDGRRISMNAGILAWVDRRALMRALRKVMGADPTKKRDARESI
jgi:hypothetical protein